MSGFLRGVLGNLHSYRGPLQIEHTYKAQQLNIFAKYGLIVFVSVIGITGQILLKQALKSFGHLEFDSFFSKIFTIIFQPLVFLAISCYVIGLLTYLYLLSKVELTSIYPICTSLTFGGIMFFGWFILNESLGFQKISGILLIIIGIFLIDRSG